MTSQEIATLRKSLNLSMSDFGKMFGVTPTAVQKWENGSNRPANLIEVSMETLKSKMEKARLKGKEKEEMETLTKLIVFGGLAAILIYLFSRD
jgi:transcriptional regulator with XRE-family HTH domain